MKLIPTCVYVEDLQHEGYKDEFTGILQSRAIKGRITIDFVSSGDMSQFIKETPNTIRIEGLSEHIGYLLIDKPIEL